MAELLQELSKIDGLRWLRLLYCYPSYFTDGLITEIAENDKVRLDFWQPCCARADISRSWRRKVPCQVNLAD